MESADLSPRPSPVSAPAATCKDPIAPVALGLSIFAFIPPLGIAAVVLGHVAEKRHHASSYDTSVARAALWIAYLQLALITLTAVVLWSLFQHLAQGLPGDAMLQHFLRESDQMSTLDPASAQEAEFNAQALVYQLVASEEQVRRQNDDGSYTCQLNQLLQAGPTDATDAEKRDFAVRLRQSPYIFRISGCNPGSYGNAVAVYTLTAVPITPRMPSDAAIFCTDQTGVVLTVPGGTSLDCLKSGRPLS